MGAPGTYGHLRGTSGARLAPEKKGLRGIRSPLGQQTSSAQEGTRSLSMVQESN